MRVLAVTGGSDGIGAQPARQLAARSLRSPRSPTP